MNETDDEALRRQTFIRMLDLTSAGTGHCPGCGQETDLFVKRTPGGGYQAVLPGLLESRVLTTSATTGTGTGLYSIRREAPRAGASRWAASARRQNRRGP